MSFGNDRALSRPQIGTRPLPAERPHVFDYSQLWQGDAPLLDTLNRLYGHRRLDSFGGSYGWSVRYRQVEDYEAIGISTLAEYIEAFKNGSVQLPYLRHLSLNRAMPELRRWLLQPAAFLPNWAALPALDRLGGPEIFIGQAGTNFGHIHQDQVSVHVGFVQLQGEKEFLLFPPGDARYLHAFKGREFPWQLRNSRVRYADVEDFDKFPELARAHPQRITLREGQALLLPADWWHTTHNITDSVSYSIRIVNASNIGRVIARHMEGIPRWLRKLTASPNQ